MIEVILQIYQSKTKFTTYVKQEAGSGLIVCVFHKALVMLSVLSFTNLKMSFSCTSK